MKKGQFYILFAFFFSFLIMFLLAKNLIYVGDDYSYLHDYFVNELSYLTAWNCSYNLTTIQDFSKVTNLNIKVFWYWDNCKNKTINVNPYKDKLVVKITDNYYLACLNETCKKIIKEGKHFCLVYQIVDSIFFDCW